MKDQKRKTIKEKEKVKKANYKKKIKKNKLEHTFTHSNITNAKHVFKYYFSKARDTSLKTST